MITKLNNKAVANVTTLPVALGDMVFISSATASASASIEFSLGSYKEYKFLFVNMHPSTNDIRFQFNCSIDNGSNYNVVKTTTYFYAYNGEGGGTGVLGYSTGSDIAQGTGYQDISGSIGNQNDETFSGTLQLFNPSSTTYVKHFITSGNTYTQDDFSQQTNIAGYFNDTNDLTNIKFQMASGNIDAGKILMFGIN